MIYLLAPICLNVVVIDLPPVYDMLLCRKWVAGLRGYLMMDISYACIPNSNGVLVRISWEPFIDGYLESFEDIMKNTYGEGNLSIERICVADDEKK